MVAALSFSLGVPFQEFENCGPGLRIARIRTASSFTAAARTSSSTRIVLIKSLTIPILASPRVLSAFRRSTHSLAITIRRKGRDGAGRRGEVGTKGMCIHYCSRLHSTPNPHDPENCFPRFPSNEEESLSSCIGKGRHRSEIW